MASINNKASVLAVKKEVTEGVLVNPSASTDYVALQEGFSFAPQFEELTSAELKNSIGAGETVLGSENPTASFDHYIRHSGVEGQEPDYGEILESVFGGKSVAASEYSTIAGSTTLIIKVGAGEGVNFERGQCLLVKDGLNFYSMRNVLSVSGDDITIGQALSVAPALGVDLGKDVLYKPADNSHPSLSIMLFRGNGGAIEAISGAKISELAISAESGQFVNGSISVEGSAYYFDPMTVKATNKYLDFNDGSVKVVSLVEKTYKDPNELASALQTAMNAVSSGITVSYSSSSGKFTIAKASGTLSLLWNTGANAANSIGSLLGFNVAADDTGSLSYLADNGISLISPQAPAFDAASPLVAKNNEVMLGGSSDTACFGARSVNFTLSNTITPIPDLCEESGVQGKIITGREVTVEVVALLSKYDVSKFTSFRQGSNVSFTYNFGEKSGGNWVAGKCANIFVPTAKISSFSVDDSDGLAILNMTLKAYVADGLGECYLNFV